MFCWQGSEILGIIQTRQLRGSPPDLICSCINQVPTTCLLSLLFSKSYVFSTYSIQSSLFLYKSLLFSTSFSSHLFIIIITSLFHLCKSSFQFLFLHSWSSYQKYHSAKDFSFDSRSMHQKCHTWFQYDKTIHDIRYGKT